ncbi:TIGR03643 family protein [Candidatus Marinimicrobia bacterium]|jgi:uncharacterized protein (TIGR03643 family)|nr:TIGR03643 family protein [bacterium]MDA9671816.1 TIGR03643 family protein [bacterium]MDC0383286.1 TIGR03643 family protein [Candidatus Neomarinimicrobiota bacterium]
MKNQSNENINRIIEMAWEDRTPFDAIESQFGVAEKDVIKIMRSNLKRRSFELWRKRVTDRKTKHKINKLDGQRRFKSKNQK